MSENEKQTVEAPLPVVRCNMKYACPVYWTGAARYRVARIVFCIVLLATIIGYGCYRYMIIGSAVQIHLKSICAALHSYHEYFNALPPAYTVDENGNRLHSWRTLLIPFMGGQHIYEKIRLDEPWDSEYNRQFHDNPSRLYYAFGKKSEPLKSWENQQYTRFQVVVGPETPFNGSKSVSFGHFEKGLSHTVLVVEATTAVHWMSPIDFPVEALKHGTMPAEKGVQAVGGYAPVAFVSMGDGSQKGLHYGTPPEVLVEMTRLKKNSKP